MNRSVQNEKSARIKRMSAVALFCALAYICVFFIRFKVMFLTFDLKDAVMAIGAMYFGPVSAFVMTALVSLIEFLTISDTGVYGLVMNFLSSATFCLVASLIYKFKKDLVGAALALVSAAAVMCGVMIVANMLITPYYMGVTGAEVRALIPTLLLPFNLTKGIFNASVVMLLYKPFSTALKASGILRARENTASSKKVSPVGNLAVMVVSVAVLIGALAVLLLALDGTVSF